jgi:hypothetical protein
MGMKLSESGHGPLREAGLHLLPKRHVAWVLFEAADTMVELGPLRVGKCERIGLEASPDRIEQLRLFGRTQPVNLAP